MTASKPSTSVERLLTVAMNQQLGTQVATSLLGKQLYRVTDAMAVLSMSRSVIYEQIRSGRLRSVTQGLTRLIPASAIADYIALLEHESKVAS
jgi:excisionase family DNA binding protein